MHKGDKKRSKRYSVYHMPEVQSENRHKIRLYNPNGLLWTTRVNGLVFTICEGRPNNFQGYRLIVDGVEFTGALIKVWASVNIPKSLQRAKKRLEEYQE